MPPMAKRGAMGMRLPGRSAAAIALLAGGIGLAGSYAVGGSSYAFVGAPVSAFVFSGMPPAVITFSIVELGNFGTHLGYAIALGLTAVILTVTAFIGIIGGHRSGTDFMAPVLTAGLGWGVAATLTRSPVAALGVGVPMGAFLVIAERRADGQRVKPGSVSRRDLLASVAGVLGFGGLAYVLGSRRPPGVPEIDGGRDTQGPLVKELLNEAEGRSLDVEGIPGLVSETDEFFEVDINMINPTISADEWTLEITGEVDTDITISYDDLTARKPEHRFMTLRCVGDPLNGDLMDNALWTGVPVVEYLDRAVPRGEYVVLRAVDGYFEEFPLSALERGFLAYGMNGESLPKARGHPVRALVPGHWGEINVKWLTEIEILDEPMKGYWEKRGWHGTGPVNTVAKLWTVNHFDDGRIQVGGHAYAGVRDIQQVEVSTDGGETWNQATLSEPLEDPDVWSQWKYEWRPSRDTHEVVVRAVDGTGTRQPQGDEADQRPFPSGAVGWVSKTIETSAT